MIVLVARYQAQAGKADEVEAALKRMAPLVHDTEPGCLLYQANRSTANPDHFLLYDQYIDEAALEAHRQTDHFRDIIEGTIVPMLESRVREFYRLVAS